MGSETKGQLVIFFCDKCGETAEIAGTWKDVWESLKEEGWRCWKTDSGAWVHRCPGCKNKNSS